MHLPTNITFVLRPRNLFHAPPAWPALWNGGTPSHGGLLGEKAATELRVREALPRAVPLFSWGCARTPRPRSEPACLTHDLDRGDHRRKLRREGARAVSNDH